MSKPVKSDDSSVEDFKPEQEGGIRFFLEDDFMLIKIIGSIGSDDLERCIDASNTIIEHGGAIEVWIDSAGGYASPAYVLCNALLETKADVTGIVFNDASSAAAWVAGCCDKLKLKPFSKFMFHRPYAFFDGEVDSRQMITCMKELTDDAKYAYENFILGFLTPQEYADYMCGQDVTLSANTIAERWPARKENLQKTKISHKTIDLM